MKPPRPSSRPTRLPLWQAWLLAALLLAAQALGLAHRVAHAPGLPGVVHAHQNHASHAGEAHAHAVGLADHEAGSPDCRLIDQLAHADALCGSASLPPALPRAAADGPSAATPALPVGSAAAYRARGPPGPAATGVFIAA